MGKHTQTCIHTHICAHTCIHIRMHGYTSYAHARPNAHTYCMILFIHNRTHMSRGHYTRAQSIISASEYKHTKTSRTNLHTCAHVIHGFHAPTRGHAEMDVLFA